MNVPLLDIVKWANGLVLFKRCEKTSVIFKWPRVWAENNYRQSVKHVSTSEACSSLRLYMPQPLMSDWPDGMKCSHSPHAPLYFLTFLKTSTTLLTYHSLEIGRRVLLGSYNTDDTTDMNHTSPGILILKSLLVALENCADCF
jgi:hypothetical protein